MQNDEPLDDSARLRSPHSGKLLTPLEYQAEEDELRKPAADESEEKRIGGLLGLVIDVVKGIMRDVAGDSEHGQQVQAAAMTDHYLYEARMPERQNLGEAELSGPSEPQRIEVAIAEFHESRPQGAEHHEASPVPRALPPHVPDFSEERSGGREF